LKRALLGDPVRLGELRDARSNRRRHGDALPVDGKIDRRQR
jgi:hypothetical protein